MEINDFRTVYTKQLWEQFISGSKIVSESLPDYVYRAWQICMENGLNPQQAPELLRLRGKELEELLEKNKTLIEIAKPVLDMILFSTGESRFIVMLTAPNGVILHVTGGMESLSVQENYYNSPGIYFDEKFFCVRATTLALREKKPISLCGSEHYLEVFHNSLCYAAPVFDHNKQVVACVSLATSLKNYNPHTLSMITAAAENIGMQVQKKYLNDKENYLSSLVYSICGTLPDGIVALDLNNIVSYVNQAVEEVFGAPSTAIVGKPITDFIQNSSMEELSYLIAAKKRNSISIFVNNKSKENKWLCRVQPLLGQNAAPVGMTLFLASDKQILQGITKVGGNRAYYHLEDIQGQSPQIKKCIQLAKKVAKKASRILITGESGTGKELFAQGVHNAGPRSSNPFVPISCASIPRELIEAELFGYVPGAFTGASKDGAVGKFELAQNGTLFLDEISSLPIEAQGKLLRALQQNEITRIGGKAPIPVNVNVISASNVNLMELVKTRMFREDLFYRLNSVEITIPPLRERPGDTELLIKFFIANYSKAQKRQVQISQSWMDAMLNHVWMGNVRELEHACEAALIICEGNILDRRHVPPALGGPASAEDELPGFAAPPQCEHLDEAFQKWLLKAVETCNGNLTEAAQKYGISRSTLYRKMKKFSLDAEAFREKQRQRRR